MVRFKEYENNNKVDCFDENDKLLASSSNPSDPQSWIVVANIYDKNNNENIFTNMLSAVYATNLALDVFLLYNKEVA